MTYTGRELLRTAEFISNREPCEDDDMSYEDNFPYIRDDNGSWIPDEEERSASVRFLKMLASVLAISAGMWFFMVLFFCL